MTSEDKLYLDYVKFVRIFFPFPYWRVSLFAFWSNAKEASKGDIKLCFCISLQTLPSRDASFPYKTQLPCMMPASTLNSSEYSMESQILDYVQELDSSFHPVLSFPSGK